MLELQKIDLFASIKRNKNNKNVKKINNSKKKMLILKMLINMLKE